MNTAEASDQVAASGPFQRLRIRRVENFQLMFLISQLVKTDICDRGQVSNAMTKLLLFLGHR